MSFNASKCTLPLLTKHSPFHLNILSQYSISNYAIQQVTCTKYLGITITNDLSWSEHITDIINKANSTRDFSQRNLSQCQPSVKSACTIFMSGLYSSTSQLFGHCICYLTLLELKWSNDNQPDSYTMIF